MSIVIDAVLRMPPDLWGRNHIDVLQRHNVYIHAADRIKKLENALELIASQKSDCDNATPEMERDCMRLIAEIALDTYGYVYDN